MAHEINRTDRFGEVRSNGKRAWHRLGIEIPDGLSAVEGFRRIGLDWQTSFAPLSADYGGKKIKVPGRAAHMRDDTGSVLGVVADDYPIVQNLDLAQFTDDLVGEGGASLETAGSLRDGKTVFALAKAPEVIRATEQDVVETYMLVTNGHGGTGSFAVYPTSVRVVCANTLRWSERDAAKGLSFIHYGKTPTEARLKAAQTALGLLRAETERFREQVDAMVRTNLSVKRAKDLFLAIYEKTFGKIPNDIDSKMAERLRARRQLILEAWETNFENERQTLAGIKGTAWAALNAVTEWHDHERGFTDEDSAARTRGNLFGVSHRDKNKALRAVLAIAK